MLTLFTSASILLAFLATPLQAQTLTIPPNAQNQVLAKSPVYAGYGVHYPNGLAAVKYLYGQEGMWRSYTGLKNIYHFFGATEAERAQLGKYANGSRAATAVDEDGNVIFNLPYNSTTASGTSFIDEVGRGENGVVQTPQFCVVWNDHNKVARYMATAYGAPVPQGITNSISRFNALGFEINGWKDLNESRGFPYRLLQGIYHVAKGNCTGAATYLNKALADAGTTYDTSTQRYTYPNVVSTLALGLLKILTDRFVENCSKSPLTASVIQAFTVAQQHTMSLRSVILSEQEQANNQPIGWTYQRNGGLINTISTTTHILALGAGAKYVYEVGSAPMRSPAGFNYRLTDHVLFATAGRSPMGSMVYGPYQVLPSGTYTVYYYLRTPDSRNALTAYVDVNDADADKVLGRADLSPGQFAGNRWIRPAVRFTQAAAHRLEFRVNWGGQADMEVGEIRVA